MNLRGMMEGPLEGRQTFVYEQDLLHGRAYTQQVPDVHFARGMACIDCHTERQVHGDGRIYVKRHYEVEIRCERCHGNPRALGLGGFTSTEHPKLEEFRQPADYRWDRIVDEEGRPLQATTVEGARPFTKDEMDRIRNAPYKFPNAAPAR